MIADMGFSPAQARKALRETVSQLVFPCECAADKFSPVTQNTRSSGCSVIPVMPEKKKQLLPSQLPHPKAPISADQPLHLPITV